MADLTIGLNNIKHFKTVKIEDIGVFRVRKLGSGEELDLSRESRKLTKLLTELNSMNIGNINLKTKKGQAELKKKETRITEITDEMNRIKEFELDTYRQCFEDENNGKDVDKLIKLLTDEERLDLFRQIFDPPIIVKTPETAESEDSTTKEASNE